MAPQRVVVAGNDEVDLVRIAVGVDDAMTGMLSLRASATAMASLVGVNYEHGVGQAASCRGYPRGLARVRRSFSFER